MFQDEWKKQEQVVALLGYEEGNKMVVTGFSTLKNTSDSPESRFKVAASDPHLVGILHTHTGRDPAPSYDDIRGIPDNYIGFVWTPSTQTLVAYDHGGFLQKWDMPGEATQFSVANALEPRATAPGTAHGRGTVDWVELAIPLDPDEYDPEEDEPYSWWRVNASFLLSNWKCIYGQGCPGHFGVQDMEVHPTTACCSIGFWTNDRADLEAVEKRVAMLTDADWDADRRADYIKRGDWAVRYKDENDDVNVKSRVVDGACIFSNRDLNKPGCAFLHLGARIDATVTDIENNEGHAQWMPDVCSTVPLRITETPEGQHVIDQWDADEWGGDDDHGTHDEWMVWWCTDTPDAYVGESALYIRMRDELTRAMGKRGYDILAEELDKRKGTVTPPYGKTVNDGRPLLPLLIGNRAPRG
jgi:proteasome lid subunit RPN8/RPN11